MTDRIVTVILLAATALTLIADRVLPRSAPRDRHPPAGTRPRRTGG